MRKSYSDFFFVKDEDIKYTTKFVNKCILINSLIVEILLIIIKCNEKSIVKAHSLFNTLDFERELNSLKVDTCP